MIEEIKLAEMSRLVRGHDAIKKQQSRTRRSIKPISAIAPPLPDEIPTTDLTESGEKEQEKGFPEQKHECATPF